ncbi:Dpcd [Symbiodinium sp. KB8]|nr:Dpcd [Symbiodinium sp. KB8]
MFKPHEGGTTTCINAGNKIMFTTTYPDGVQMAEEVAGDTGELLVRKWKGGGGLGSTASWEYEIGEPATTADAAAASSTVGSAAASASGGAALRVSSSNPTLVCRESREAYIWRVRNLPYPKSVYSLSVDDDKQQIVLRTSNKKYYKRISVPGMARSGCALDPAALSFTHANNTLVITLAKPKAVLEADADAADARKAAAAGQGSARCAQQ